MPRAGHEVSGLAFCGREALSVLEQAGGDPVLIDIRVDGGIDSRQLAEVVEDRYGIPLIHPTGNSGEETRKRAMAPGPSDYVLKPYSWRRYGVRSRRCPRHPGPTELVRAGLEELSYASLLLFFRLDPLT